MPWDKDALREKDSNIGSDKEARQAEHIANEVLKRTGDEGRALREAFGIVRKGQGGVGGTRDEA